MRTKEIVQSMIRSSLDDPIAKTIAKYGHLTKIQLETLLIDILSENIAGKSLKYDEKSNFRLTKARISRGAFNRTLRQAKVNATKSIYTVLLLGYLGMMESPSLNPYLEISNKLHEYIEACKNTANGNTNSAEHLKALEIIREGLENSFKLLSDPSITSV